MIKHLVKKRRRDVSGASDKNILGGAEFFEKTLDFSDHSAASETGRAERREKRKRWVGEAVEKAKKAGKVPLEPVLLEPVLAAAVLRVPRKSRFADKTRSSG